MDLESQLGLERPAQRIAALAELSRSGEEILDQPRVQEALFGVLADSVKAVQRVAVEVVVQAARTRPGLASRLRAALASSEPRLRWAAAFALGRLGGPPAESLPVLLENLGSGDGDVRWAAQALLLRLAQNERQVRSEALRLAGSAADRTRRMALYLLRDLGQRDRVLDELAVAALQDPDRSVRLAAINTIIKLEVTQPAALERLRQVQRNDPVAGVQRAASAALKRLSSCVRPGS
jgi:HEAT repeat protein